jgi:hypothetical protein
MLVKSMLVPLVDATAVPAVITLLPIELITAPVIVGLVSVLLVRVSVVALPTSVSVAAGSVTVFVPETAGADSVIAPLVSPETTIEAMRTP